jgi:hypothetical protein
MSIPTTASDGQNIVVTWIEPYDDSDPITDYRVFVRGDDHEFT